MAKKKYPSGADATHEHQAGKDARLAKILDDAGAALKAEGVKYFLGVVDRQPEAEDGGKVHTQSEIENTDFVFILDAAFPTRKDLVDLGLWVGRMLNATK